ncbi:hypothetical protein F5B17DRAFT_427254 [Nemania serpens]|nr:hypothetical protein F5B17DRAFT_427254 [Nemania serpens]
MPSTSNTSVCHAQASRKPEHYYSSHPPTAHPTDEQSLETYRLSSYSRDPHHPPMASSQSPASIEAAHKQRIARQADGILSRFYQR